MATERFELLEQIGKGGMGTVWKARDTGTGEVVALKLLHDMYVDDADYVARFEREVDIARRIDSPHVVKVLGYGKRGGVPYVAMEYVDGPSLKELIRTRGAQGWEDWGQAKRIALQLTEALRAAHAVGVIHRDVKPSNVLIDPQGNVKLADFGIARAADLTRMTGGYTMLGTPAYMSPEGDSSEQSDLYGLGCVLYEQLTGSPPFTGDTQQQVLIKHIRELPDLTRLPEASRPVVGWLLEKNPKKRPATAEALIGVLEGSTADSRPRAAIPGETGAAAAGGGSNRRKVALFGGVPLVVLVAGAGVAFALAEGSDPTPAAVEATATPQTQSPTATATTTPSPTPTSTPTVTPTPTPSPSATPKSTPVPPTAPPMPPTATLPPATPTSVAPISSSPPSLHFLASETRLTTPTESRTIDLIIESPDLPLSGALILLHYDSRYIRVEEFQLNNNESSFFGSYVQIVQLAYNKPCTNWIGIPCAGDMETIVSLVLPDSKRSGSGTIGHFTFSISGLTSGGSTSIFPVGNPITGSLPNYDFLSLPLVVRRD